MQIAIKHNYDINGPCKILKGKKQCNAYNILQEHTKYDSGTEQESESDPC